MPNPAVRKFLAMDEGEPALVIVRRTWSNGQPVTFGRFHHPGSRYELAGHYAPPGTERSMPTDVAQLETIEQ